MPQIAALFLMAVVIDCIMAGTIDGATVALGGTLALLLALTRA